MQLTALGTICSALSYKRLPWKVIGYILALDLIFIRSTITISSGWGSQLHTQVFLYATHHKTYENNRKKGKSKGKEFKHQENTQRTFPTKSIPC